MGDNKEQAPVKISWNFKPANYFEEEFTTRFESLSLTIREGIASVKMAADQYDEDPGIRDRLDRFLNSLFEGVRLQSFENYELSKKGAISRTEVEGQTTQYLSGSIRIEGKMTARLDAVRYNDQGEIVQDTRAERIHEKQEFAQKISRWKGHNALLDAILRSWGNAIKYPENEFSYLYEVREALSKEFGGEKSVINTLAIDKKDYKELGRLANHEPVRQSRHRGVNVKDLRDASQDELIQARSIARQMIMRYINYLETQENQN